MLKKNDTGYKVLLLILLGLNTMVRNADGEYKLDTGPMGWSALSTSTYSTQAIQMTISAEKRAKYVSFHRQFQGKLLNGYLFILC